jgi:hypothetical protein
VFSLVPKSDNRSLNPTTRAELAISIQANWQ